MTGFVLASLLTLAQVVTLPLAAPPAGPNAGAIVDAMLAISRAAQSNPTGAQAASFSYAKAIERYRVGDIGAAQREALFAISQTTQQPFPTAVAPAISILTVPAPTMRLPLIASPAAIDADAFLALARGAVARCAERGDPHTASATARLAAAANANAAGRFQTVRSEARAAIDDCALISP